MPYEPPKSATPAPSARPPVPAQPVARSRLAAFERSAIVGITLLVSASLALQSLVSAHGHVVGDGRGAAVAASAAIAPPITSLVAPKTNGVRQHHDVQRHSALDRLQAMAARLDARAIARVGEIGGELRSDSQANGNADIVSNAGLRTDTFGPETERKPKLRLASIGSLPSVSAGSAATARPRAVNQAVLVVRPGDREIVVKDGDVREVAPRPRILGRDTATARVEKVHFQPHTPERCLPHDLLDVIYDVAEKFGEVQILSTFRDSERNRRVGGAEQSFHLSCQAIDFRVNGRHAGLLSYLENRVEVGGLKRYPMGYFHIDNGPRRSW